MQGEGFCKTSIEESDAAIRAAIGMSATPPSQSEAPQAAQNNDSSGPETAVDSPKSWRFRAVLLVCSAVLGFFLAPGVIPDSDLPRFALTALAASVVAFLIGSLFWSVSSTPSGRTFSGAVILGLAPVYIFGVSVVEDRDGGFPSTILSERGLAAIPTTVAQVFGGTGLAQNEGGGDASNGLSPINTEEGGGSSQRALLLLEAGIIQREQRINGETTTLGDLFFCEQKYSIHPSLGVFDESNYCSIVKERPLYAIHRTCGGNPYDDRAVILTNRTAVLFQYEVVRNHDDWQEMMDSPNVHIVRSSDGAIEQMIERRANYVPENDRISNTDRVNVFGFNGDQRTMQRYWLSLDALRRDLARFDCFADDALPPR